MLSKEEYKEIQNVVWADEAQDYARLANMQDAGLSRDEIGKQLNTKQRPDDYGHKENYNKTE